MHAGVHTIGAALVPRDRFRRRRRGLQHRLRRPLVVSSVVIAGPYNATALAKPRPQKDFRLPARPPSEELACAKKILSTFARHAFRRPIADNDSSLETLINFYQAGRDSGTFEAGIQQALARVLVDPQFLFRFERDPSNVRDGGIYRLSDLELASRLSFFLWSRIPDDDASGRCR